jgi:hypothetical protein
LTNKYYRRVLEIVFEAYVKKLFPFPEALTLDTKRFIVRSAAKEMGFERNIRNLPLAQNLLVNLFCDFWIDYAQNEDLFQVFQVDEETVDSIKKHSGEFYDQYQSSK